MNWNYPTNIWFGEGKIEDLANACLNLKMKNPLFVTSKSHQNYKLKAITFKLAQNKL